MSLPNSLRSLPHLLLITLFVILTVLVRSTELKECYRCKNAQTFSSNLTTSLLALASGKPCVLEPIRCARNEHSCVYGLVSVVVAGGFWFHLSGCYVESINETHCYRGAGPVNWPGYTAELRANYCLCGAKNEPDLCNDSKFAKAVVTHNLYDKKGGDRFYLPKSRSTASSSSPSSIKQRASSKANHPPSRREQRVGSANNNRWTSSRSLFRAMFGLWILFLSIQWK